MILILAILTGMLTGSACYAADINRPIDDRPLTLAQFVSGIVTRSADLNYVSETDSEVFVFYRNTPVQHLIEPAFLSILRRPQDTEIVRLSWPTFFKLRSQNDPTRRWRVLQDYLEANLTSLTIFRLQRYAPYAAQYDLYAVGIYHGGTVVGVQMFGVAT